MYVYSNMTLKESLNEPDWGQFIQPDIELQHYENPDDKYKIARGSAYTPNFLPFQHLSSDFNRIAVAMTNERKKFKFEDQCSEKYYFDLYSLMHALKGKYNRVVDVGVFMGGSSNIIAGCLENSEADLVLVDFKAVYLHLTYERIRRLCPSVAKKTRLFLGDLPTYIYKVAQHELGVKNLFHHDGSHNFNEVIRDLSALSFIKDKVNGLIIQDTHLRAGNPHANLFVDAALYAVFGGKMPLYEIGIKLQQGTKPDQSNPFNVYFMDNQAEGMYIPFEKAMFRYPHPSIPLESFLPQAEFRAIPEKIV